MLIMFRLAIRCPSLLARNYHQPKRSMDCAYKVKNMHISKYKFCGYEVSSDMLSNISGSRRAYAFCL